MKNVLIVEADEEIREILEVYLRVRGYQSSYASSRDEVLQMILGGRSFDAILLDSPMPGLNSEMFVKEIRKHHPGTCILLITSTADINRDLVGIKDAGLHFVLRKPFLIEDLDKILLQCLIVEDGGVPNAV